MTKYKLEYIWLDGYEPVPNLRSKTKVEAFGAFPTLAELPLWNFDGSSTRQAPGSSGIVARLLLGCGVPSGSSTSHMTSAPFSRAGSGNTATGCSTQSESPPGA